MLYSNYRLRDYIVLFLMFNAFWCIGQETIDLRDVLIKNEGNKDICTKFSTLYEKYQIGASNKNECLEEYNEVISSLFNIQTKCRGRLNAEELKTVIEYLDKIIDVKKKNIDCFGGDDFEGYKLMLNNKYEDFLKQTLQYKDSIQKIEKTPPKKPPALDGSSMALPGEEVKSPSRISSATSAAS